jgi:hypothetical protein
MATSLDTAALNHALQLYIISASQMVRGKLLMTFYLVISVPRSSTWGLFFLIIVIFHDVVDIIHFNYF